MLPDSVKYSNVRNHVILEPETIELLTLIQNKWPDNSDHFNLIMNKKMREALLQVYSDWLNFESESRFDEKMRQKHANS